MDNNIETLRKELEQLVEETSCLCSEEVVRLSEELDRLICRYYKNTVSV